MHHRDLLRPSSGRLCSTSDHCASRRTIGRRISARASENGSVTPSNRSTVNSDSRLEPVDLRNQLCDLQSLVRAQQQQLQQQQQSIEQFQGVPGRTHPLAAGWGSLRAGAPPTTGLLRDERTSPFDSQRIGIGDRRLLGLFDSRFHSTSRWEVPMHSCSACTSHMQSDLWVLSACGVSVA